MRRITPFFPAFGFILLFSVCEFIQGCAVQKRHYRKGFYVQSRQKVHEKDVVKEVRPRRLPAIERAEKTEQNIPVAINEPVLVATAERSGGIPEVVSQKNIIGNTNPQTAVNLNKEATKNLVRKEQGRKVEFMGILGFLSSVAGWVMLVYLPIGFVQALLFAAAAILAALSMRKMSSEPGRYLLKTLSFVALLLALIGLAVMLYAGLIYLLS